MRTHKHVYGPPPPRCTHVRPPAHAYRRTHRSTHAHTVTNTEASASSRIQGRTDTLPEAHAPSAPGRAGAALRAHWPSAGALPTLYTWRRGGPRQPHLPKCNYPRFYRPSPVTAPAPASSPRPPRRLPRRLPEVPGGPGRPGGSPLPPAAAAGARGRPGDGCGGAGVGCGRKGADAAFPFAPRRPRARTEGRAALCGEQGPGQQRGASTGGRGGGAASRARASSFPPPPPGPPSPVPVPRPPRPAGGAWRDQK